MYVRLAFAVAAHLEPEILIIDEVLAVGDTPFQKKCLGKMGDVAPDDGRTVLFVSHNMGALSQLCELGILLEQGRVTNIGPTKDVIKAYLKSGLDHNSAMAQFQDDATKPGQFRCARPCMPTAASARISAATSRSRCVSHMRFASRSGTAT